MRIISLLKKTTVVAFMIGGVAGLVAALGAEEMDA